MESNQPGPLGLMSPQSITESIQNCLLITEESRRRLLPLVSLLDEEATNINGVTDGQLVHEFMICIENAFGAVERLMGCLADCGLVPPDGHTNTNNNRLNGAGGSGGENESVYLLMASNCITKACDFITCHYMKLIDADSLEGDGPLDDRGASNYEEVKIQPCMARLAELTLRIVHISSLFPCNGHSTHINTEETISEIIESYTEYQRHCLRSRSKPSITSLAELRKVASSQNCYVSDIIEQERVRQQMESGLHLHHDDDNAHDVGGNVERAQPHAQCVTVILGEASSLIQPLAVWRDALPPANTTNYHTNGSNSSNSVETNIRNLCQQAMKTLDNEAQSLAVKVGSWFTPDQRALTQQQQQQQQQHDQQQVDLNSMEAALEEMAFMCQVLSRYCLFSTQTVQCHESQVSNNSESRSSNETQSKLLNLLTELSLHYSTHETHLATLQFNQAYTLASPQTIELGHAAQVPSIVEDAHFVCVRAVERAVGTRSERAVWTVGHWICEVWGFGGKSSVFGALMEGVGCSGGDLNLGNKSVVGSDHTAKVKSSFAASLLEAVDGDIGPDKGQGSSITPPLSGGILWGKGGNEQTLQSKVDAELCALNGIHSAANACMALSALFGDLVEERLEGDDIGNGGVPNDKTSMLTFARDELSSHSRSYHNLLQQRVRTLVFDLCGADDLFDCDGRLGLQNLRFLIEREVYNLDAQSFKVAESDDRLEAEMIGPIRQSQIFDEIGKDKCDIAVVLVMAEAMSWKSAEIILQVLLKERKEFNDWGAMLLSKQVRALQNVYCGLVLGSDSKDNTKQSNTRSTAINTSTILKQFERVNQAVSLLQLEKPSDWLAFAYKVGESDDTNLTTDEIRSIMSLRLDFSEEAIAKVCSQISSK